ncbi:hypothetical protein GOEFS_016_00060 [Gordonia effusa NBRC 100432]|uniref:Uncharacterized protein n=1 Tax=Gordonia effusa NBRC 100432 TaxID=1077974 RepID=H0QVM9_9ACTN|nr:hypothetical protein [Gordonia effusa]GAB16880.1 hypothetical protein GOEFS_016_00060 [Gordonia effusa NBRC 100432]
MKTTKIAVSAAGALALALGLPTLAAAPASAATTVLCSMNYSNPNIIGGLVQGTTTVSVTPDGAGSITLTVKTDSRSAIGYNQYFSGSWANLDTGKSGEVGYSTRRVVGSDNIVTIPHVTTLPGRVTFQVGVSNSSTVSTVGSTGQCGKEIVVN